MEHHFEPWLNAEVVAEYDFPMDIVPMRQGHGRKMLNKTYQDAIVQMVDEYDYPRVPRGTRIGLRIVFLGKFHGDQSNCIKMIEDGMKRKAFYDDDTIDYHQVVRWPAPKPSITVQILERR